MNEKDWLILQTLHKEKKISKTADRLYMSQPALTYRLKQIEEEYGITLMHRGKKGVEFTSQGEVLIQHVKEMAQKTRNIKELLLSLDDEDKGILHLGVARALALHSLPDIVKEFRHNYPKIDLTINTGLNLALIEAVYKQDYHVGIVRGKYHWPYEEKVLTKENISILSNRKIKLSDLPQMPRIDFETEPTLTMTLDRWWKENFTVPPLVPMKVENAEIAKRMALSGLGYTIVPSLVFEKNDTSYRINLAHDNGEPILLTTSIIYRKESLKIPVVKKFIDFVINYYGLLENKQ